MNKRRLVGSMAAICIAFGLTDLDFDSMAFETNKAAYILISLGLMLALMAFWSRLKK